MKLKHLFLAAIMMLPFAASAVPAYPGVITRTNPDGTTVELRVHGDEFFSYVTNTNNVLMQQNAEGYWAPMMIDGIQLVATEDVVNNLLNGSGAMKMRQKSDIQRIAALDSDGRTTYPTIGDDIHSLVVLMEYSDTKFTVENPKEAFSKWLNEEGYSDNDAYGSVRDYYMATSYGQFKPIFDVEGVVSLPETSEYYTGGNKYRSFYKALEYAVAALDDEVDFSKYDYDNDGVIDTIYFIYAGFGQADTLDESTIWPHQSTMKQYGITLDGKEFGPYATSNELTGLCYGKPNKIIDGIGTFVHEYGHVLGLPDLYDPNYKQNAITPGYWSTMCSGCYNMEKNRPALFSAYEKWLCKWTEPEYIVEGTEYELLTTDQENRAIKIPVYRRGGESENKREFFLLESRSREGWDAGFADDGLLIWHIDFNVTYWTSNSVNSTPAHPRCFLVTADGSGNPFTGNYGEASGGAAWPSFRANNTFISPDTEITLDLYTSGAENNHYITSIAFDEEQKKSTFKYNVVTESPDITTLMRTPNSLYNERGREAYDLRFYWEPVEGASTYFLSVYREKDDGTKLYLNKCNELNVGNVTSYDLVSVAKHLWGEKFKAYVRVCQELPASTTSNIVEFVPENLTRVPSTSVTDVEIDENAPVEFYNLQGVRVANPENGLFIRRQGNKVEKVFIKQ